MQKNQVRVLYYIHVHIYGGCVTFAADATEPGDAAFAAIKVTGLGRVEFLVRCTAYM